MTDDVRAMAVKLASMGLPVFRIKAGEKTPLEKGFYDKANADPEIVGKRFTDIDGTPINCNVGVLCNSSLPDGRRLHVIDVDAKNGKKGLETLEQLKQRGLNTDTLTVRTPSGGIHLYYGAPADWPELGNSEQKLGPGVDTRGYHGYVVGPGSVVGNKPYELVRNGQIATLEPWMLELLQSRKSFEDKSTWLCEPDLPKNVERATDHAAGYPRAEEGARNAQLFVLAKDMRKFGVSHELAKAIIFEQWPTASGLSEDEFEKTVRSAYDGPQMEPAGVWDADAQFDDIHESVDETATQSPAAIAKARFTFETIGDLRKLPALKWLVGGWMQDGGVGIVYGRYGSGKSFMMFDLAMHLAHGKREWHSYALPGVASDVLVIASEGKDGFIDRIDAFKTAYGIQEDTDKLVFMRQSVNFMNDVEFKALSEAIKDSGRKFRLVIIDTVQRTIPGADQNTQESIGLFMDRCRRLGAVTGATTIGVHHENKTGGLLGSIVFQNDSDFVYQVRKKNPEAPLGECEVRCEKLKDGTDGWTRNISFVNVSFGDRNSLVVDNVGTENVAQPKSDKRKGLGLPAHLASLVFDAVQAAYDRGAPWNLGSTSKAAGRNLYVNAAAILAPHGVKPAMVKHWVDLWRSDTMGLIVPSTRKVGGVRQAGMRVDQEKLLVYLVVDPVDNSLISLGEQGRPADGLPVVDRVDPDGLFT